MTRRSAASACATCCRSLSTVAPPFCCIVGEPTSMKVASGHKGKSSRTPLSRPRARIPPSRRWRSTPSTSPATSSAALRGLQAELAEQGARDRGLRRSLHDRACRADRGRARAQHRARPLRPRFRDPPPRRRRPAKADGADRCCAEAIRQPYRERAPEAAIAISIENDYPGLDMDAGSRGVAFVQGLTGETGTIKVAFGTEAGLS